MERSIDDDVTGQPRTGLVAGSARANARTGPITWTGVVFDTASTGSQDISVSCP